LRLLGPLMAAAAAVSFGAGSVDAQVPTPEPAAACLPATAGFVSGRVSEKFVDSPGLVVHPSPLSISGATVELLEYGLTTVSDANGCFAFEVPPSDSPVPLFTVRASAPGFGSLTVANLLGPADDGIGVGDLQLERGGPSRLVDHCQFEAAPESAARRRWYEVCAAQGRLTGPTVLSPAAPPVTGSGSVVSGSQVIPLPLIALFLAAGIAALAAAVRMAAPRRTR